VRSTVARKKKLLQFDIRYTVEPENANIEEALEQLRQYGSAEIIDTRVIEK
jgi:hypothetical protein